MLSEKTEILRLIQTEPGRTIASILEYYGMKDHKRRSGYIRELEADHYIFFENLHDLRDFPLARLSLTSFGEEYLEQLDKEASENAKDDAKKKAEESKRLKERAEDYAHEERRYRTQNKIAIIMPIVTFFLGMAVEHFAGIVSFFFSLFHS